MEGQTINIQAIINPISGVGSKRKIPKMIETAFAGENCCVNFFYRISRTCQRTDAESP